MTLSISFFSNFFNAHQIPIALDLVNTLDVNYSFVAMRRIDGLAGRACLNDEYPFVVRPYLGASEADEAMKHAVEDDIVVFGDMEGDERFVRARAKTGKLFSVTLSEFSSVGIGGVLLLLKSLGRIRDLQDTVVTICSCSAREHMLAGIYVSRAFPRISVSNGVISPFLMRRIRGLRDRANRNPRSCSLRRGWSPGNMLIFRSSSQGS